MITDIDMMTFFFFYLTVVSENNYFLSNYSS